MIVGPILFVIAGTGALYIFKDEIERAVHPELLNVTPTDSPRSFDAAVNAANASIGRKADQIEIEADLTRPVGVLYFGDEEFHRVYADPYRGAALGELPGSSFFEVVLRIHRQLFIGTTGRIIVELSTCWTIVLLMTGILLWWPRRWSQLAGVFWPRWRKKQYAVLRDMHAVAGAYLAPVAMLIAATGLLYTYFWGTAYQGTAVATGAYAMFDQAPPSKPNASGKRLSLDQIVAQAHTAYPDAPMSVDLPNEPDHSYVVYVAQEYGPNLAAVMAVDAYSGKVLSNHTHADTPILGRWSNWNYRLHVGSVLGTPTKILWLLACFVLMALPVTGVWMWWQRRPSGRTGFPRPREMALPKSAVVALIVTGIALPTVGASLIAVLGTEAIRNLLRRRRAFQSKAV